jgi:hypothetical protein
MDGGMHDDEFVDEESSKNKLFSRGAAIYYFGSLVFIVGIALIVLGSALIMFFELGTTSELQEILYTIISVAVGIILILLGINLMMKQTRKGYAIIVLSVTAVSLSLFLFINYYPANWYYPLVGYVFGLYVAGFLLLLGNTFAGAILWIIGSKPGFMPGPVEDEEPAHLYTDAEIQKDIEDATRKSAEAAVAELQFNDVSELPSDIIGVHISETPKNITRVKDKITEVNSLGQTLSPGMTEKWGSVGIDKASDALAKALDPVKTKKKGFFQRIKEKYFSDKPKKETKKEKKVKSKEEKTEKNQSK